MVYFYLLSFIAIVFTFSLASANSNSDKQVVFSDHYSAKPNGRTETDTFKVNKTSAPGMLQVKIGNGKAVAIQNCANISVVKKIKCLISNLLVQVELKYNRPAQFQLTLNGVVVASSVQFPVRLGFFEVPVTLIQKNTFSAFLKGSSSADMAVKIRATSQIPNILPLAKFTMTPEMGIVPVTVQFDALTSSDPDGLIVDYFWNFSDNTTAVGAFPFKTFTQPGTYRVQLTVKDNQGGIAVATKNLIVQLDTVAPVLANVTPIDNETLRSLTINVTGSANEPLTEVQIILDGEAAVLADIALDQNNFSKTLVATATGVHTLVLRAKDRAQNVTEKTVSFTIDIPLPPRADLKLVNQSSSVAPSLLLFNAGLSTDPKNQQLTYHWDFGNGESKIAPALTTHLYENPGTYSVKVTVTNTSGLTDQKIISVTVLALQLPEKPELIAPVLTQNTSTTFEERVGFLYQGAAPIQKNLVPGAIVSDRLVVIKGIVLNDSLQPVGGVKIYDHRYSDLGFTYTRDDGKYDFVLNGGGRSHLTFEKTNHLPVQRSVDTQYNDFYNLDQVILVSVDAKATVVTNNLATPQLIESSIISDKDGTREIKLIIPANTKATVENQDGTLTELPTLTMRLTEYTTGENGPEKMPASLPVTSGYTFAFDLTADEAMALNAKHIQFSKPVPYYVDNFLGFRAGTIVPVGGYDSVKSIWMPEENGRVIQVLEITNSEAKLDIRGDGVIATATELASLGIDTAELQIIAQKYAAGKTFWRARASRFSPKDCNFFTAGYGSPPAMPVPKGQQEPIVCAMQKKASIIDVTSQNLREEIACVGIQPSLFYSASRSGFKNTDFSIPVQLTAFVDPGLKNVILTVDVAGQVFEKQFVPANNLIFKYIWDGKDGYGRLVSESAIAKVKITYQYEQNYFAPFFSTFVNLPAFGSFYTGLSDTLIRAREFGTTESTYQVVLGTPSRFNKTESGWSFSNHHLLETATRTIHFGDGTKAGEINAIDTNKSTLSRVAGTSVAGFSGNGGSARLAQLNAPNYIYYASDKSIYFMEDNNFRIRRILPSGIIENFAGNGTAGSAGDGGLAINAQLGSSTFVSISEGPDQEMFIADFINHKIRKIDKNGIITTIAGSGVAGYSGDNGPAINAQFKNIEFIYYKDGSLYIADSGNARIREIMPNGIVRTIAGTGIPGRPVANEEALVANIGYPSGLGFLQSGELVFADRDNNQIFKINRFGRIELIAGTGVLGNSGDLGNAVNAEIGRPTRLQITKDNSIYFIDRTNNMFKVINAQGIIRTFAGNGTANVATVGSNPLSSGFADARGFTVAPDGTVYITERLSHRILKISSPFDVLKDGANNYFIPSKDGSEIFVFDLKGRHLRTLFGLTGLIKWQFDYDTSDRLVRMTDENGRFTRIIRDAAGAMTSLIAPYGQVTQINSVNQQLVKIIHPNGEFFEMQYGANNILSQFRKPNGAVSTFIYSEDDALTKDTNALGGFQFLEMISQSAQRVNVQISSALGAKTSTIVVQSNSFTSVSNSESSGYSVLATSSGTSSAFRSNQGVEKVVYSLIDPRFAASNEYIGQRNISKASQNYQMYRSRSYSNFVTLFNFKMTETTVENGNTSQSFYDGVLKTTTFTSAENRISSLQRDNQTKPIAIRKGNYTPLQINYDTQGRRIASIQGDRQTQYTYGPNGLVSSMTDPIGRISAYEYDQNLRLTKQTLPDGRFISYRYDANNNIIGITPPGRSEHTMVSDLLDQMTSYLPAFISAGNAQTTYEYTLDKEISKVSRPDGRELQYIYAPTTRNLSQIRTSAGNYAMSYFPNALLSSITSPDGITHNFTYSSDLVQSVSTASSIVQFSYNNFHLPAAINLVGGSNIVFSYDKDQLLTQAGDQALAYDANGALVSKQLGSVRTNYGYTAFGELSTQTCDYSGAVFYSASIARDKISRVTSKNQNILGVSSNFEYAYNLSGYLTEVKKNGVVVSSYVYDSNGNRVSKTSSTGILNSIYDEQDRLLESGTKKYTYNLNGDLSRIENGSTTELFNYDEFGQLKSFDRGSTQISYLSDGLHRRSSKSVNGVRKQVYAYQSGNQIIATYDGLNQLEAQFIYGSKGHSPDYMIKLGTRYNIVSDELGSVRLVVNSATGEVVQQMEYDEFGVVVLDTNPGFQPFGYAGGLYDVDTKLVRFGARDYDPTVGRWTTKDPIGFAGGDTNLYGYVMNDPINFVDPTGLSDQDVRNIRKQFGQSVDRMSRTGMRRPGSGLLNGILNNLSMAGNTLMGQDPGFLGCGGQAVEVKDDLMLNLGKTDDKWTFEIEENLSPVGLHMNIKGTSSNSADPILILDPWRNSLSPSR